jgi:hypothetical protein
MPGEGEGFGVCVTGGFGETVPIDDWVEARGIDGVKVEFGDGVELQACTTSIDKRVLTENRNREFFITIYPIRSLSINKCK